MARRLNTFVHVDGVAYGPGVDVPPEVAKRIGDHAWDDDAEVRGEDVPETVEPTGPGTQQPATAEAPPRSGRGSGIDAWRKYVEDNGVDMPTDASREDLIAAAEDAGLIEPEQPKE